MQFNKFLIFAFAFFGFLSLSLARPTSDAAVNHLEGRDGYTLYCPGSGIVASDCSTRFGTQCDADGLIVNEVAPTDSANHCNSNVCICWPNSIAITATQPAVEEPSVQSVGTSVYNFDSESHISTAINTGPTMDARSVVPETSLKPRGFGQDWELICPRTNANTINADECWRRYATRCDDNGKVYNSWWRGGLPEICTARTCYCRQRPGYEFGTPYTPPTTASIIAGFVGISSPHRIVVDPGVPVAKIPTTLVISKSAAATPTNS